MIDNDIIFMNKQELIDEIKKLRNGIREHRDSSGHNLCWYVPELWNLLPDKITPEPNIPPEHEFLECCKVYRKSLDNK